MDINNIDNADNVNKYFKRKETMVATTMLYVNEDNEETEFKTLKIDTKASGQGNYKLVSEWWSATLKWQEVDKNG